MNKIIIITIAVLALCALAFDWSDPDVSVLDCAAFDSIEACEQYMDDNPPTYIQPPVSDVVFDKPEGWREKAAKRRIDNLAAKARLGR